MTNKLFLYRYSCLLVMMILLVAAPLAGQDTALLKTFNKERIQITRSALLILGGWSAVNIGSGLIAMGKTNGEATYFYQMNTIWNTINLGIAAAGYWSARKLKPSAYNWQKSMYEQNRINKIYFVNGALDLAYILGGLYAREYGKDQTGKAQNRWKGYGTSIIVQGSFLLIYDVVFFTMHQHHGKKLYKKFDQIQCAFAPGSISTAITF